MLQTSAGKQQLQNMFSTCTVPSATLDQETFMESLMGNWMGVVQYNDELGNPVTINYLCDIMANATDALEGAITVNKLFLDQQNMTCLDISYADGIQYLKNVTNFGTTGVGDRQWTYQTCAEFGYFQTTDSPNQPFGNLVPLSLSLQTCTDAFSFNFSTAELINNTNAYYGARDLGTGPTNILFVNGDIDPWHSLSVIEDVSSTVRAILINGTAHCADMFPATPQDPPGLAIAQEEVSKQVGSWLDDYYNDLNYKHIQIISGV